MLNKIEKLTYRIRRKMWTVIRRTVSIISILVNKSKSEREK